MHSVILSFCHAFSSDRLDHMLFGKVITARHMSEFKSRCGKYSTRSTIDLRPCCLASHICLASDRANRQQNHHDVWWFILKYEAWWGRIFGISVATLILNCFIRLLSIESTPTMQVLKHTYSQGCISHKTLTAEVICFSLNPQCDGDCFGRLV